MSHMTNIIKKEVRELLTPGSVISVLFMVVLFAGLGGLIGGEVDSAAELPTFGLIAEDGDYYEDWNPTDVLKSAYGEDSYKIVMMDSTCDSSDADIVAEMQERGITSVIALPSIASFNQSITDQTQISVRQYYLYEPTGLFGSVSSTVMSSVVTILSNSLSQKLISDTGSEINYEFLMSPIGTAGEDISTIVDGQAHSGITPYDISNEITSQTLMIPIVIMIIIMMVGSIVISSMGSEKENKTLETLLTMPVKRTSIVSGKIVAAAIVGLVYGLAYMVGMSIYMGSMTGSITGSSSISLEDLGMALGAADWVLVMVSMFLAIVCALGICMILGAFAKNYKSAQTMTMPLSILAMIPMFIIMFTGWYGAGGAIQFITFIIPFSHPMMAMQALMYGDMTLVIGGIVYMAAFAIVSILITVRLYNSDILITGLGQNKYIQKLTGKN
ncbi:MAG TPA: ABC transporter permease [Euryarchaeota archaeon]|nr:ABC transporter permease [Euryarchaeota archaeon]